MGGMYKDFYELDIWKDGYELSMKIYTESEHFPSEEKFALSQQIRRSSNSIIANIAESHGKYSYQDKVRVLYIARGEVTETRSHLAVAFGRRYIDKVIFDALNTGYLILIKKLNSYIAGIQKNANH